MKECGWTLRNAFLYLKRQRPLLEPNDGFKYQLMAAELKLRGSISITPADWKMPSNMLPAAMSLDTKSGREYMKNIVEPVNDYLVQHK